MPARARGPGRGFPAGLSGAALAVGPVSGQPLVMGADHTHHHHAHHDGPARGRPFVLGIALNLAFVAVELGAGLWFQSMALLADAGHNLGDVLALALGWVAVLLAASPPSERRTYGWRRVTILGALLSAAVLMLGLGMLAWESVQRLGVESAPPEPIPVMVVAGLGVLINAASAALFVAGRRHDLNQRAAFQHLMADAAVSLGVLLSAAGFLLTGWDWLDPLAGLLVVGVVLVSTWGLLRESVDLLTDAVPRHIDPLAVRQLLLGRSEVADVHDLHIWAMSTTDVALTAHLVTPLGGLDEGALADLAGQLNERFGIGHTTLQVERGPAGQSCVAPGAGCD